MASREESKQATRRALLEAGLAEIVERGFDSPSLDSICARAGFTRGAFYVHFANREDFVVQLMDWVISDFLDQVMAADSDPGTLQDVVMRFLNALDGGHLPQNRLGLRFPQMLEASQRMPEIQARFGAFTREAVERVAKNVIEAQQRGETRSDIDSGSLATLLVAAAIGGMALRDAGIPFELDTMRHTLVRLLGDG